MSRPLVEIEEAAVELGGRIVLHDVDFAIGASEIVTVVGPNGSGKSTLLRLMIGALQPRSGHMRRQPGLRFGYVPQQLRLDSTLPLTVARFMCLPKRQTARAIDEALKRVGMQEQAARPLAALSGGQRQRVALARALLGEPQLLLLDEPTQGLDQPAIAEFYRLIAELRASLGCAVVMVSHDLHVVMSASDRVICLNGHICCQGAPALVASAPQYRALFGSGTQGTMALYRHKHDHVHEDDHLHGHARHHEQGPAA